VDLITTIPLFGFPVLSTKINKDSYDKKSIISTIEKNFKLNKKRNLWDKVSVLHHAYDDYSNPAYHKVNFSTLMPVYHKVLLAMFKEVMILSGCEFKFEIVNYTCLAKSNFMASHIHPNADFTAVHYIQFDNKHHTSTVFENTAPYIEYIQNLRPELIKILSNQHTLNSWAYKDWTFTTKEDDFYFSPAFLKHRIDPQISKNKNRITIVLNIKLTRKISKKK
tara:strand:- start:143 stop:808 length:666 start_codon:yes stop_codon:yes gene_type:complete